MIFVAVNNLTKGDATIGRFDVRLGSCIGKYKLFQIGLSFELVFALDAYHGTLF